jgi:hypothetical protein
VSGGENGGARRGGGRGKEDSGREGERSTCVVVLKASTRTEVTATPSTLQLEREREE